MKELDSFTVEQLNDFIKSDHAQCGDVAALARIALAAKRAEPVYQYHTGIINEEGDIDWYWVDCDKGFYSQYDNQHRRIVYTTPQLNSQVPLGSWINCSDQMPEDDEYYLTHSTAGVDVTIFHDGRFQDEYATHWMPLPAAPESE
ncbi:DUF551 domain-containing protein [Yersinia enterocolitica]